MQPIFTFAIVNWNTRELLRSCINSIRVHAAHVPHEIFVTDNASQDGSQEMLASCFPDIKVVANQINLGFAKAHAQLINLSRGRYHVLVNSDVHLHEGAIDCIQKRMDTETDIAVLGCQIVGPDGAVQPSCRRFPSLGSQFIQASGINRLLPRSRFWNAYLMGDFDHKSSRDVDQVMGSLFVIRREACEEVGFLDTDFFMYYEEVDFCWRCKKAGWRVFFEAQASIWHEGGGSSNQVKTLTIRRTVRSMRHYFRKNVGSWTWLPLLLIVSLDTVTHAIHALFTNRKPLAVLKAYLLASWDLLTFRRADS